MENLSKTLGAESCVVASGQTFGLGPLGLQMDTHFLGDSVRWWASEGPSDSCDLAIKIMTNPV